MNGETNASYLYVANALRGTDTIAGMANGSIAIVNEVGTVLTGATTTGDARVLQKLANGQKIYSPYFDMATRKNTAGRSYLAPTQQVSYLGYADVAGTSLTVAANSDYVVNIEWQNTAGIYNNKPLMLSGGYRSTAASQKEITTGLMYSLDGVMDRQPYAWAKIERVADGVQVALAAAAAVVKGLKGVTITAHGLAAGAVIRLAGVMYVVASVPDVNTIVLDSAYKGATASIVAGTTAATQGGTVAAPVNWGLKFTGVESTGFNPMTDTWKLTRFNIISSDFPTSEVVNSTKANDGSGYYKKVANQEAYSQFLDKSPFISAYPRNDERSESTDGKGYDFITFEVVEAIETSVATGLTTSKRFNIQIALSDALTGDDVDTVFGVTV